MTSDDARIGLEQQTWRSIHFETWRTRRGWWCQIAEISEGPFESRGDAAKWAMGVINGLYKVAEDAR